MKSKRVHSLSCIGNTRPQKQIRDQSCGHPVWLELVFWLHKCSQVVQKLDTVGCCRAGAVKGEQCGVSSSSSRSSDKLAVGSAVG